MCTNYTNNKNYTKIILWNILQVKYKLPNELIIKILYTHKGLQHPLAYMIDNGIGWSWSSTFKYYKYLSIERKKFMILYSLERSRKIITNKIRCNICNIQPHNYNPHKTVCYSTIDTEFKTWTSTLLVFELIYGKKLLNYRCNNCYNICFT